VPNGSGDWTNYYTALRHLGEYYQVMVRRGKGLLNGLVLTMLL
jgi:hypothetical protein